jgi:hypothetical protein
MAKWQFQKKAEGLYLVKDGRRFAFTFAYVSANQIKGEGIFCTHSIMDGKAVTDESLNLLGRDELRFARQEAKNALLALLSKQTAAP